MKRLLLLLLLCMSGWVVRGQSECRYWFDQNQASIVSSTSANSSWTIPVDAGGLQAGFHTLYLQVRNGTSPWDAPMSYVFYKPKQSSSADVYQCWFDQNYANAQTGMVGTGFTLDVSALLPGFHTVYIRISHGTEEQLQSFIFYKPIFPSGTATYQCWFDQNYANAQTGIVGTGFALDASTLLPGFHTAYIRISHEAKEQLQSFIFYKPSLSSSTDVYQCWFDQNYASRQTGSVGTGFNINVSALQPGFHTLYTRIGENTKTQTQSFIFYKQKDSDCSSYTCWIDEDESSAVRGTLGNGDILLDVSGLDGGMHIVNIRLCSGDSTRVESYEFMAPDPPRSLPYCDDFESTEHLYMPDGWTTFNEGECTTHDLGRPRVYQGIGYEGSKELDFFSPCLQVAVLPLFAIDNIRNVRIICKAKSSNASGCFLRVGVMSDPTDLSTFVDVDTLRCESTEVWEDISASLARYHGTGTAIAFYFVSDGAARGCIYIDNLCVTESHIVVDTFASTPDTLVWHDSVYRASTVDTLHFTTAGGDSTVVLHLTVTGWPDNVDSARCAIIPEMSQWGIRIDWSSDNIVSVLNTPLVGDLDGDGHPEIVCFARNGDNPNVDPRCNNRILVFDGVTKQIKATLNLPTWVSGFDAAAYGLVKLPNGTGLIVTADFDFKLRAYDITSATPSTPYWTSDVDFGTGNHEWAANVNFADFNHDGHPEVYIRNKIYNAETGVLLATAPTDHAGASYAHWTHNGAHPYKLSAPIAADVLGDASLELILGNEVYSVDITNTDGTAGNSLTLSCRAQPPAGVPEDGHSQVADFNGDGHLDILITLRTTYTTDGNVYAYVWDVSAGTVSNALNINTNWTGKSIPLIADIDNDGLMEMLIQTGVSGTNEHFQAYKYHPDSQTFTLQWGFSTDENSYSNSITAFDFNQDGLLELMISDQSTMRIVNGSGKSHITAGDTIPMYILGSIPFSQNTIMQYPLIVDVDADGCAEIVSVGSDKLNIFKSSVGTSWGPARKVWNQYMYNATCINEDLTVPQYTFNNAQSLIDPDGIIRRPYNNFLQQQTTLDRYGRPFSAAADIVAHSASLSLDDDTVRLIVNYSNQGDANLQVPYGITLYKNQYRGAAILSDTLTQPSAFSPQSSDFHTITFPRSLLCSLSPSDSILITLNDLGSGIAQHGATHPECDTTNNIIKIATPIYHNSGDTTAVACDNFTWYGLDYPASCSTQHTLSNYAGCDSIVTLNLTIHHPITSDTSASACDNFFWNRTHETYSTTGNYSYHYVNDNGCIDTIKLALVLYGNHSYISEGALPAVFSVSDSKQVFFSHGNLQYQASTNTWRFAENQYDYIGNANANISPTYSGWIDLFAWGCSGWNSGANTYQPWSTNVNPADYLPGGNYENNLDGEYAEADWAWHNAIINGGNRAHVWRTLTITEWEYLLQGRPNALSKRGAATVGAIHGMVVLPDDWTLPNGLSFTPAFNNWTTNVYTLEQWQQMEDAGALFLPAAGFRHPQGNTGNFGVGNYGRYWSSSHYNEASSLYMLLYRSYTRCDWWDSRIVGLSVRPVQQAHPIPDTIISACDNFTFNNHTYTSSGTYYDTLSNIHGCDSITILKLTIRNSSTTTDTQSICDSYTWIDGQTYTASNNTATHTLTNVAGCDSTVTLNLTVNYSNHGDTTATECESFTWWSTNYTNSTNEATHPYTNQWGCDSTVTLLLTINNPVHEAESQTACEIYTWQGSAYTSSGNYIYSYADANGCTQVDTLHLTVNYSTTGTETVTACNSFVWHGTEYTESTSTPTHTTTNAAGCDSITTLHLTVNHCSTTTLIVCDSLSWHGGTYTSSGIYTVSTDTLNLTVNHSSIGTDTQISCDTYTWIDGLTYTASNNTATHTLTNAAGCDSTVTLDLTIIASPSLSHSPDTSLLQGSNLTLWASGADILSWTDTSGSIQANDSTFAITPLKSSVYVVTAANEGVNLVYNGDFELGNTGFTTSHTYNSHTNEGAYYIGTNARNQYPSFAIWHDHTSGNGQYMIVNGAGNPNANVWTQTIPVEPNTDYAFSSWICNLSPRAAVSGNLADVAQLQFSINGSQLGDIFYVPEMAGWVKVYEVWNSGNNSSATITILNQNTGWAGNDFGIDDIHFSSLATCAKQDSVKVRIYSVTEIDSSVCDNNLPFVWQGQTITAGGIYRDTVANIYGDDSIVVLNLTVRLSSTSTFEETIVENQLPYTFNEQTFTDSTDLTLVTIPNAVGCDSTINYTLHIQWNTGSRLDSNVCFNQLPVTWNNTLFDTTVANTTIMRTVVIPSVSGSDSTIIMRLHVRPIYNDTIPYSICDNQTHTFEGTVYGGTDAGFHSHMLHTATYGCDSLRVLNLEVRPTTTGDTVANHCDSFTWYGTEYTASTDTPTHLSLNSVQCDSTTTLHLTIRYSSTSSIEETIVENQLPYTFNEQTFTDSTDLTLVTIPNAVGCDSTISYTLHIQWNTGSRLDSNVCFNQLPVTWNNTLFDTTVANTIVMRTVVIPSVSGSDSTIIMRLHVRPIYNDTIPYSICDNQTHTFEGTVYGGTDAGFHSHMLHTATYGCDSLRVLNLEVRPTTTGDTVANHCDSFTWYGTEYTASTDTPTHLSQNSVQCDSTTTLHLTIRYSSTSSIEETIVENQLPYTFNGQTFTDSTSLTLVTIPNAVGCDSTISYTLHIQWNTGSRLDSNVCFNQLPVTWNNALFDTTVANTTIMRTVVIPSVSGSDSTIIMRLHVRPIYNDTIPYSICDNQTHTFEGTVYGGADAGFHSHMLHTATYGCDSLRVLNLEVRPTTTGDTVANHCDSFTWYGTEYTTSTDTPTHLSSNAVNCDSTTTLHLTIRYSSTSSIEETIVENQLPYTFNGQTFTDSTDLTLVTIPNAVQCDSAISYTLHIQWNTGSRLDSNVCFNQLPVTWNNALFDTTIANTIVMRTVVIPSATGSDSTIIMRLHVRPIHNDTIPYSICDNQTHTFEGTVYGGTDAGFHPHMLHTATYGCDSLRVLNLEVRPTTTGDTVADHCDSFTWYGTEYTASTDTPTHLSQNSVQCDSATTLHLTIRYSSTSSIEETIVENQLPYTFNGQTFTDSTSLTLVTIPNAVGCDSTISYTLHIQWNTGSCLDSNVCFNQLPVTWNNALFDTTVANTIVMRTVVIPSVSGSDSTIIMRLHVRPIYNDTIPYSICDNQTHTFEGTVYGGADAGFHSHMLHTYAYGCDSLRVLNLEVRPTTTGDTVADHCDSFTWYGTEYTTSTDTPTHLSSNAVNCDSTTTLHLTIRYSTIGVEVDTVIENLLPYNYHDSTFADSISHVSVVFSNTVQCDSVVDFTLFVHRNVDTTLYDTVCNDALPLTWNGVVFDTLVAESATMTRATVFTARTGADSTITMYLTVHALYDHHSTVAICDNQQYTFGDSTFVPNASLTHNIDTSQYIEHLDSLLSIHGCDSLSTLHLTSWSTYDHHLSDTVCTNHTYTWGTPQRGIFAPGSVTASLHSRDTTVQLTILDSHFPADTLVTDHLASAHSCDSLSSLHLHLLPSYDLHFSDTICNAEWAMASGQWVPHSYPFEDTTYSTTGTYPHPLSTLHSPLSTQPRSCDSTRTLHLKVWPTYDQHLYDTIYDGDHYTFEGTVYDTTGVYLHRLDAVFACDSLRTLHLQRNRRTYNDSNLCQNALPLVWNGVTFADRPHTGGMLAMSDSVHLSGLNGIDSLVVMTVYAHDTSSTVDLLHGCDSLTWQDGHTYHASTTAPFVTLTNRAQCDSVVHLALTVDYTHYYTDRHVVCDSMRWINNSWYYRDTAGVVDTIRTIADCDSVITLDLTVHYSTSTALHDTICYNDTYYWHGFTIHSTAVYRTEDFPLTDTLRTIHGCDSVVGMIVTKMALPQVDLVHEIDCAAKGYRIIADARAPFSPDSDPQPMPYLLWTAVPIDDALEGQERQTVVKVAPQSLTEYMVFVDYRETPFCPTTARLTLRPVIIDTASIKVNPQILTYDNLSFDAYDLTTEHARSQRPGEIEQWQRTWYVDGVRQWERNRHLAGEADAESDSVIVALEVYNGICYDTALTVIPIRRVALFAPNIFTPLEDDNNRFVIVTTGVIDAELYIYNREGLLVYYTSDLSQGWDGRTNDGKICPQGNYVWRLNYHATDRPHHLRTEVGSVILLK